MSPKPSVIIHAQKISVLSLPAWSRIKPLAGSPKLYELAERGSGREPRWHDFRGWRGLLGRVVCSILAVAGPAYAGMVRPSLHTSRRMF
jgi:hypothetical protein